MSRLTDADLDAILRRTFEDRVLSRGERKALAELVAATDDPPETRALARSRAFLLARELVPKSAFPAVLDWLEEVNKALVDRGGDTPDTGRSEAHFSPRDNVYQRIVRALDACRTRADLAVFTITDDRITSAILAAHERGVRVRIVADNDKAHDLGSDIERLAAAGIRVRVDRTPVHMHHKFAVFDQHRLLTGSYNWTRSANAENAENILLTDDPTLVRAYSDEFERCWQVADDVR